MGAADSLRLVNVRYHLKVVDPTIGKLIVPAVSLLSLDRTQYTDASGKPIARGTQDQEFDEMIVWPHSIVVVLPPLQPDTPDELSVGDSDTVSVKGKGIKAGITNIKCRVLADPDMDYIFPKGEDTPFSTTTLQVID